MSYPYLLISDTHYHSWDAFSAFNDDGMNSRLQILLDETRRAFDTLIKAGGTRVFHAGDMFHTRGSLVPSVINPVRKLYASYAEHGLTINAIAGNHDLESNDTFWLTAATAAMPVQFAADVTDHGDVVLVNWYSKTAELYAALMELSRTRRDPDLTDLVIHAPVDNVLVGIPSHGLTAPMLAELGFRRVFAGHYHNHKDFGGGVYSIGALTHQTWSDVGTKAGFCLVYPDRVEWIESQAPKFIDIPVAAFEEGGEELLANVTGNYCRITVENPTKTLEATISSTITRLRAAGLLLRCTRSASKMTTRRAETSGIATLEETVGKFAELKGGPELAKLCAEIMTVTP